MAEIMAQLHQDHINLSRLLGVLSSKLDRLKEGERPDYQLMLDAIRYIVDYADAYHHPLEDVIYHYASDHFPENQALLTEVEQEHHQIRQASEAFQTLTENILMDAIVPMEEYTRHLEAFIHQQTVHLNREEGRIFPVLNQMMAENDWNAVMQTISHREDPLFGDHVAEEYKRLYQALMPENEAA